MNVPRTFQARKGIKVPDRTRVFPFLNSNDVFSGLPVGLLDDFSIAMGEISPDASSRIQVHPVVTQVTFVLDGRLEVRLKAPEDERPLTFDLAEHQAVLVRPGAFLQLVNQSVVPCRTLYVVGPAYVFEVDEHERVVYDDSVSLSETWDQLEAAGWRSESLAPVDEVAAARAASLQRLGARTTS